MVSVPVFFFIIIYHGGLFTSKLNYNATFFLLLKGNVIVNTIIINPLLQLYN